MVNFIFDLEDKYAAQVEKLGLTVGALKTARTASDDAYRVLTKMVNAPALVLAKKDYTAFIDYVNTEVTHYKREVIG